MEAYYADDTMMRNNEEREDEEDEDDESQLPGFRFYPTDEEIVDFYLRRKVENKPFTLDLIKEIDIYKFDPWDLPKSSTIGDNEWYFFCKRGRKYRNSVRPNRVTGSGFWKATGIDKPIRSHNTIVGLKKSLVYYTGNAGKGTKTDWMMHEFRLPAPLDFITHNSPPPMAAVSNDIDTAQEAEVWTVCRIFKRNVPSRKYTSNWREISTKRNQPSSIGSMAVNIASNSSAQAAGSSCATNKTKLNKSPIKGENYISFSSNYDDQQQISLIQNPNNSTSISHYDHNMSRLTSSSILPAVCLGHEQLCGTSSSYNPMPPRTETTTTNMAHTTPASSSHPHELSVSPMDIAINYQEQRNDDQFGTDESTWDDQLKQYWSSFQ
ncbi:unnamed protein product [Rhodiola kirilowii]